MTARFEILYVCNGDNARAPLAAACARRIVTALPDDVAWTIDSAGTEVAEGSPIRPEAQRAATVIDIDLLAHTPTALGVERCESPDLILAMSWDQVSHIWSVVPQAWDKVFTMKEFVHWAKRAPARPPILFADRSEAMRDKVIQTHAVRKRARADYGFWGGVRPQDLNLIEPNGKGDQAWNTLANAVQALTSDVMTLLRGPDPTPARPSRHRTRPRAKSKAKPKAKARR